MVPPSWNSYGTTTIDTTNFWLRIVKVTLIFIWWYYEKTDKFCNHVTSNETWVSLLFIYWYYRQTNFVTMSLVMKHGSHKIPKIECQLIEYHSRPVLKALPPSKSTGHIEIYVDHILRPKVCPTGWFISKDKEMQGVVSNTLLALLHHLQETEMFAVY